MVVPSPSPSFQVWFYPLPTAEAELLQLWLLTPVETAVVHVWIRARTASCCSSDPSVKDSEEQLSSELRPVQRTVGAS